MLGTAMSFFTSTRTLLAAAAIAVATVPVPPRAETALNMALVSRTVFYLPAWMAEKQGFFKAEGLDIKMKVYDSSDQITVDLRNNEQQIALSSIESVVADAYKGGTVRLGAGKAKPPPHLITRPPRNKKL